ncbi:MAG: hypothetical protein WCG74_07775 [Sediminibacterium sp.]
MKNNKKYQPFVAIFPNIFKTWGVIVILLAFGSMVFVRQMHLFGESSKQMELVKLITKQSFLAGLFLIVFSKAKIEDERTNLIRLYVFTAAFWFGVLQVLIIPIINYFIPFDSSEMSAFQVFFQMLLLIIILPFVIHILKRKTNDE